mmetsp:Transcript_7228/g.17597  ORF Transcript_7228/g.17597 Transcript_7228/m.17597 type:complete len:440 (-) Transcript_7228:139-1458(-)
MNSNSNSDNTNRNNSSSIDATTRKTEVPEVTNRDCDFDLDRPGTNQENRKLESEKLKNDSKIKIYDNFDDMGLKTKLLRGIYGYGFEKPTIIQQQALMPIVNGMDVIAQAQAGAGKTGAFAIASLQVIDTTLKEPQVLVLSPVRQLARQTDNVAKGLGTHLDFRSQLCVGGTSIRDAREEFRRGVQVVAGTPGRVIAMIRERTFRTNKMKLLVLDEADEMLSFGFRDQVYDIFQEMPSEIQVVLVSATMPPEVIELSKRFMRDPVKILIPKTQLPVEAIAQFYVAVDEEQWKLPTICDLYDIMSVNQSIIFLNTRRKVEYLAEELTNRDHSVSMIHGDFKEEDRRKIVDEFRSGKTRVLLTTDILARGLDFQNLNLVINYDLPGDRENYIHRVGRVGRHGRKGVAINLLSKEDVRSMRELEEYYGMKVRELPSNFTENL